MIRQTAAMLLDAYRQLNSRFMFWLCMIITLTIVGIFAVIGVKEVAGSPRLTLLWWELPFPAMAGNAAELYRYLFVVWGIDIWLTSAGLFLALVSTAGMIPDLLSSGSIELYLSRPISRTRLFLTKYVAGLLFVTLQVTVFAVASFLVIGLRGGEWMPRLLLAVPIVVLLFSYLWSISALAAVLTRSAVGAVILTMAVWTVIPILSTTERLVLTTYHGVRVAAEQAPPFIEAARLSLLTQQAKANAAATPEERARAQAAVAENRRLLDDLTDKLAKASRSLGTMETWIGVIGTAKTLLPKTAETAALLKPAVLTESQLQRLAVTQAQNNQFEIGKIDGFPLPGVSEVRREIDAYYARRDTTWIIGTSLGFQAFMLLVACWRFSQRDF